MRKKKLVELCSLFFKKKRKKRKKKKEDLKLGRVREWDWEDLAQNNACKGNRLGHPAGRGKDGQIEKDSLISRSINRAWAGLPKSCRNREVREVRERRPAR